MGYVVWYIHCIYIWKQSARVCAAGQRHPEGTVDLQPTRSTATPRVPLTRDQTMYRPQSYIVG